MSRPIRRNGCEILVTKGKIPNQSRPLYVIAAYLPPGLKKAKLDLHISTIENIINQIKLNDKAPRIILGGDINRYDISPALQEFLDFKEVMSPPTERLDRIFSNIPQVNLRRLNHPQARSPTTLS